MSLALGILGHAPAATLDFLAKLQVLTPAKTDRGHLRVVMDLNPAVDDRAGMRGGATLAEMAGALRGAGAEVLALVSNSAHASADMIQRASGLPVLDMIAAAASAARSEGLRRVGVLGGRASLRLYREYLAAQAMGLVTLSPERQDVFVAALDRLRAGETGKEVRSQLGDLVKELAGLGAEAVIVGAVEAALVLDPARLPVDLIDPSEMAARRCVSVCLGFDPIPATPG